MLSWWDTAEFVFLTVGLTLKLCSQATSHPLSCVLWLAQSPLPRFSIAVYTAGANVSQTFVVSNKAFPLAATCWSLSMSLMLADSSYF